MYCYNVGCSKKFEPNENTEKSCIYHVRPPVFHDGKKGWDCCKKFSTDFSTCLNTPGCQVGYHNPNKPVEPEKPKLDPKFDTPVVVVNPIVETPERPSGDAEMISLSLQVLPSLELDIVKRLEQIAKDKTCGETGDGNAVAIGTSCNNRGCNLTYDGVHMLKDVCRYHSGEPIFHEGLKFWTCCNRRTTEWDSFMRQEGCVSGEHCWHKRLVKADCRFDWFQAGANLTISFYSKLVMPQSIAVRANSVRLEVAFEFDCGVSAFERKFELLEEIDPCFSSVKVSSNKLEIVLRKKRTFNWSNLEVRPNNR